MPRPRWHPDAYGQQITTGWGRDRAKGHQGRQGQPCPTGQGSDSLTKATGPILIDMCRRGLSTQRLTLFVAGMHCRRCVREVTARLRDVPGVETVAADARHSLIRVSGTMERADVLRALDDWAGRDQDSDHVCKSGDS